MFSEDTLTSILLVATMLSLLTCTRQVVYALISFAYFLLLLLTK